MVPGNCSLSLAPLRIDQRDAFSRMFRLIEEMPEAAFDAGVDWRWGEGFGGWLDALEGNLAINVASLVGHSVLRMHTLPQRTGASLVAALEAGEGLSICSLAPGVIDTPMQAVVRSAGADAFPDVARFQAMKAEGLAIDSIPPMGAIYLTVRICPFGQTTPSGQVLRTNEEIRRYVLNEAGVGIVPFQAFGVPGDEGWFRLSVGAASLAEIAEALPRLAAAMRALKA